MGYQIDIVEHLRSFACVSLLLDGFTFDSNSVIQKKWKEVRSSTLNEIPKVRWAKGTPNQRQKADLIKCQGLVNHIQKSISFTNP